MGTTSFSGRKHVFRLCTVGSARHGKHTPLRNSIVASTGSRCSRFGGPYIDVSVGASNTHH